MSSIMFLYLLDPNWRPILKMGTTNPLEYVNSNANSMYLPVMSQEEIIGTILSLNNCSA